MAGDGELVGHSNDDEIQDEVVVSLSGDPDETSATTEPPPDGGYGWVCVGSVFIINGFTWGVTAVSFPLMQRRLCRVHLSIHLRLSVCVCVRVS